MLRTPSTRLSITFAFRIVGAPLVAAAILLVSSGAVTHAAASPVSVVTGTQYTALRRQKRWDPTLTYGKVQADPTRYIGKVIEIAGKVEGSSSDGTTLSVVVVLADGTSASIDLPVSALPVIQDDPTARLRLLVEVGEPGNSNVAPMKVLGYAHESEVRSLELAAEAKEQAYREAQERKHKSDENWKHEAERVVNHGAAPVSSNSATPPQNAAAGTLASYLTARAQPLFWPYYNYIARTNERLDSGAVGKITFHLLNFADRYNVDPRLIVAMIFAESHFNPNATSHSGAMGLGQLMPNTAKALGVDNPYDPVQNLGGSINYLRSRLDTFADHAAPGGAMSFEQAALAMAAYNAGANAVKKYNGIPPYTQTQNYVKKVISLYQQLCR